MNLKSTCQHITELLDEGRSTHDAQMVELVQELVDKADEVLALIDREELLKQVITALLPLAEAQAVVLSKAAGPDSSDWKLATNHIAMGRIVLR